MTLPVERPMLGQAPAEYDQGFMNALIIELENFAERLNTIGLVRATQVRITDLPTSSVGLTSGYLWNDSGTVKVA